MKVNRGTVSCRTVRATMALTDRIPIDMWKSLLTLQKSFGTSLKQGSAKLIPRSGSSKLKIFRTQVLTDYTPKLVLVLKLIRSDPFWGNNFKLVVTILRSAVMQIQFIWLQVKNEHLHLIDPLHLGERLFKVTLVKVYSWVRLENCLIIFWKIVFGVESVYRYPNHREAAKQL